ncbi:cell wall synthesis protein CwsA [Mycolicibacillus parakoreensis]|uniref:Cell wall synthesis protein CwsA n=2 Tax=Mycobacteriaceae TaxID=1762 RepID=A0ABY3TYP2_9MYCO|nr:cell wall synthesis protein CwsA [Mycolicibacillus parakoreensis]MCV7316626.1 cell wall synthesis protein CwsA [Mycolicibacillus parakoreensis]ULN52837.1 cell wall synthesis protein CwsA [Mycolicibacillus parakoreensis]HLR98376.1 cell wall synthesis protein CwsA [Mycolicibacillus parakoreensis]
MSRKPATVLRGAPGDAEALTARQRLARGLTYTAVGPVDVTRGVVGLGVHTARRGAAGLRRRYRDGQLAREVGAAGDTLADEFAAAQQVVAGLPQALREARREQQRRSRRPWLIAGVAAAAVAGGVTAVVLIRRSAHRDDEASPRPPSVEVQPRP